MSEVSSSVDRNMQSSEIPAPGPALVANAGTCDGTGLANAGASGGSDSSRASTKSASRTWPNGASDSFGAFVRRVPASGIGAGRAAEGEAKGATTSAGGARAAALPPPAALSSPDLIRRRRGSRASVTHVLPSRMHRTHGSPSHAALALWHSTHAFFFMAERGPEAEAAAMPSFFERGLKSAGSFRTTGGSCTETPTPRAAASKGDSLAGTRASLPEGAAPPALSERKIWPVGRSNSASAGAVAESSSDSEGGRGGAAPLSEPAGMVGAEHRFSSGLPKRGWPLRASVTPSASSDADDDAPPARLPPPSSPP
mmetsp:Transcript_21938/g.64602  ORF Transcript_21938/g.64602 Transcript_21938/m.64602 type:complete len:312 (+) Transcript_21938:260-1195(+)